MKTSKTFPSLLAVALVSIIASQLNATITLTPSDPNISGADPQNPKADDVESITGFSGEMESLYKSNVGDPEEGSFADSYNTTYGPDANDPEDATISWGGVPAPFITNPQYLVVKGGASGDPVWYLFDISDWDGQMDIVLTDFWPANNAISHLDIMGGIGEVIPEPASVIAWALLFPIGVVVGCYSRRRRR